MPITSINSNMFPQAEVGASNVTGSQLKEGKSFFETLGQSIGQTDNLLKESDKTAENMAAGKAENIHEALIALEKAETAFKLMVQIRNKALDAYTEIMRMQV